MTYALQDLATVQGCSRRFNIKDRAEWVPETHYPVTQEVTSFYVKFAPEGDIESTEEDTAVIRLMDSDRYVIIVIIIFIVIDFTIITLLSLIVIIIIIIVRSRSKMYTIKVSKEGGRMSLLHSQFSTPFFLLGNSQTEREVDTATDPRWLNINQIRHKSIS